MVPLERALVASYRPSIVTFPLYLVYFIYALQIAAFVLLHASFSNSHPISSLLKFPNVPIGVTGWPLGYEERRC